MIGHGHRQNRAGVHGNPAQGTYYITGPEARAAIQAIQGIAGWGSVGIPGPEQVARDGAGIELGETEAWRAWRIKDGMLRSVAVEKVWVPDVPMEAKLDKNGLVFGVHCCRDEAAAKEMARQGCYPHGAWGRVLLWGRIVEGTVGYRAQYARIISIAGTTDEYRIEHGFWAGRRLKKLRRYYHTED